MGNTGKANLFANTFSSKFVLPDERANEYSHLKNGTSEQAFPLLPTVDAAEKMLQALNVDSGTGPDQLPARILKYCAKQLALPLTLLAF